MCQANTDILTPTCTVDYHIFKAFGGIDLLDQMNVNYSCFEKEKVVQEVAIPLVQLKHD